LAKKRQCIGKLGNGDVGQEPLAGDAFGNQLFGGRRDFDRWAVVFDAFAGLFGADMAEHLHPGRDVVELFAGLFADAAQHRPAGTPFLIFRNVVQDLDAGQIRRQRLAAALFTGVCRDNNLFVFLDGRNGCVGDKQRQLVGRNERQRFGIVGQPVSSKDMPDMYHNLLDLYIFIILSRRFISLRSGTLQLFAP
jgi:hypothetical protein